jgi:outer membrane protein
MIRTVLVLFICALPAAVCWPADVEPWIDQDNVRQPTGRLAMLSSLHGMCSFDGPSGSVSLAEAVERVLCNSPETRKAWASLVAQIAQLKVDEAAYWPSLSGSGSLGLDHSTNGVKEAPFYDSDISSRGRGVGVTLSMTLFDSGKRSATVERSRQLVAAANASQDEAFQEAFLSAAQAYYDTVDAEASLQSARRAEEVAKDTLNVAEARYSGGTGVLTDKLQAQTAYLQSEAKRITAEGDFASARGSLAVAMGLPAEAQLSLSMPSTQPAKSFPPPPPSDLIAEAKRTNPKIIAARAQLNAAEAAEKAAIAEGRPSIALSAGLTRNNKSIVGLHNTFGINDIPASSLGRDKNVQLKLTVPMFDGFARSYAVRQARAQAAAGNADLDTAEQQITVDVWKAYQLVIAQTQTVTVTAELLLSASQSLHATEERYRSGSGNIVDVLNAQTALASAEQQRIEALSSWRTAKLKLAETLGQVGLWALE